MRYLSTARAAWRPSVMAQTTRRLAPSHVARAEDSWNAGHVVLIRKDVASWVKLEVELFDHAALLRAEKAEGLLDSNFQTIPCRRHANPFLSVLYPI